MMEATRARIVELALAGHPPAAIHELLNKAVAQAEIYPVLHKAREAGTPIPKFKRGWPRPAGGKTFVLTPDIVALLRPAADARAITVGALSRQILEAIARDNLFAAILDEALRSSSEAVAHRGGNA